MNASRLMIFIALPLLAAACAGNPPQQGAQKDSPYCLKETGSRIPGQCNQGRSVSRDELERTGSSDTGEALSRRVPSISRGPR